MEVERRVAEAMRGGGRGTGFRQASGGGGNNSMVSGLNPDDYDIPTFFKNAD